ncbi:MAG: FtsX-like permease family protein [Rhodospirillales bacterium]|nr:FtsX-like permease family protein [Rhodospirillales bacterium]
MVFARQVPASWRIARRELRGGVRGFRVFLACLILGVGITAAVGSLGEALKAGLARDARMILGGDVELMKFSQPLVDEAKAWLNANTAALSHVVTMRGMAHAEDGSSRSLVELKAVDGAYPLVDRARLEDGTALANALAEGGAAVEKGLLDRLGIGIGDRLRVGMAALTVRAVLAREPDRLTGGISLGPRLMMDHASLQATRLVQPGTLVRHRYRALVPGGMEVADWVAGLETAFPDAGWRLRDTRDANPSLRRQLDRVGLFLTLAGLAALLVGGIGVASAVSSHLHGKLHTIAALKCVGATRATVQRAFLLQMGVLGLGAIAAGLVIGAAAPRILAAIMGDALPVPLAGVIHGAPLALAAAYGALTMLAFSLWPLGRAARTRPGVLFRGAAAPASGWPPLAAIIGTVLAAGALAGIAVGTAPRPGIALGFVLGAPVALAIFRAAAALVVVLARRTRPRRLPALRLGFANLARPGAPTVPVAMSLGTGLAVLVAIALVEGNLGAMLSEQRNDERPAFFFLDIQKHQAAPFERLVEKTAGAEFGRGVPMLRGRVVRIAGVPVRDATVAPGSEWVTQSDIGLSYAAERPPNAEITAGEWWPVDYDGPPLVSLTEEVAHDFGLGLGDTLSINVLGREFTAEVASLRRVDWTAFDINFVVIFSPGVLEGAPQTQLATAHATPEAEPVLERAVTEHFANITAIPIRAIIEALDELMGRIGVAIQAVAGLTVAAGLLVLAGATAAGHERRVHDAVVFKVLGARRGDLLRAFLAEHILLGCAIAGLAIGIGTLAAWAFVTQVLDLQWRFLPEYVAVTAAACITMTLVLGFASTWRALGRKAAPLLRVE